MTLREVGQTTVAYVYLILGTTVNKTSTMCFLPFLHSSPFVPTDVAKYSPVFIRHTIMAHQHDDCIPSARKQVLDPSNDCVGLRPSIFISSICHKWSRDRHPNRADPWSSTRSPFTTKMNKKSILKTISDPLSTRTQIRLRRWRDQDKELVIEVLTERADSM